MLLKCCTLSVQFSAVQLLSRIRLFATHELQHARPPCPSPTPGVHSDSRPSSQWCHPAISSSVIPFSSCPNPSQHQSPFQWVNCHQIWKAQQSPQDWKRSVIIPISKKGNAKECSSYHTTEFTSHATKVMLKILQARLQQYLIWELSDIQSEFRKGSGTRNQITIIGWNMEKAKVFQKKHLLCFIDYAKVFDCLDHKKLENI